MSDYFLNNFKKDIIETIKEKIVEVSRNSENLLLGQEILWVEEIQYTIEFLTEY